MSSEGNILKFNFLVACFLLMTPSAKCQSLDGALKWLDEVLEYQYPNADQGKWWINRMEYDLERGEIRIQNASADHPKDIASKQWIHRSVLLEHLDPQSIRVDEVANNRGRVVKGRVVTISTVGRDRLIEKAIDGETASSENFLQFSIPQALLDQTSYLADSLSYYLSEAVLAAARLTPQHSPEENLPPIFEVFSGEFQCPGFIRRFTALYPAVSEYEDLEDGAVVQKGFVGYDYEASHFFEWAVSKNEVFQRQYELVTGDDVVLVAQSGTPRELHVRSKLFFILKEYSTELTCWRIGYD